MDPVTPYSDEDLKALRDHALKSLSEFSKILELKIPRDENFYPEIWERMWKWNEFCLLLIAENMYRSLEEPVPSEFLHTLRQCLDCQKETVLTIVTNQITERVN